MKKFFLVFVFLLSVPVFAEVENPNQAAVTGAGDSGIQNPIDPGDSGPYLGSWSCRSNKLFSDIPQGTITYNSETGTTHIHISNLGNNQPTDLNIESNKRWSNLMIKSRARVKDSTGNIIPDFLPNGVAIVMSHKKYFAPAPPGAYAYMNISGINFPVSAAGETLIWMKTAIRLETVTGKELEVIFTCR